MPADHTTQTVVVFLARQDARGSFTLLQLTLRHLRAHGRPSETKSSRIDKMLNNTLTHELTNGLAMLTTRIRILPKTIVSRCFEGPIRVQFDLIRGSIKG